MEYQEQTKKPFNPLLEELLHGLKPVNWTELEQFIPEWTTEEKINNQAIMVELELERLERLEFEKYREKIATEQTSIA